MRSSADRGSDNDVFLPAVLTEKHHGRRKKYHEFRASRRGRELADLPGQIFSRRSRKHRALIALLLGPYEIEGHIQYRDLLVKLTGPVGLLAA